MRTVDKIEKSGLMIDVNDDSDETDRLPEQDY